jgi:hypothetical protein
LPRAELVTPVPSAHSARRPGRPALVTLPPRACRDLGPDSLPPPSPASG